MLDLLKCQGTETVLFNIEDGRGNKIRLDKDTDLRTDITNTVSESFKKTSFIMTAVSKEAYDNTLLETRCRTSYTGKISDIAQTIIKQTLKSNKKIFVDDTENTLKGEYGKDRFPFQMLLDLQKLSIPDIQNAKGKMAGYLFWQTSEGFHFKSLDKLFDKTGKTIKKYVLNHAVDRETIPFGYDDKILYHYANRRSQGLQQFHSGAFGTLLEVYDDVTKTYTKEAPFTAKEKGIGIIAASTFPKENKDYKGKETVRL